MSAWTWLAFVFVQVALICGLGHVLARRRAAAWRSRVWSAVLWACLAAPLWTAAWGATETRLVTLPSPLSRTEPEIVRVPASPLRVDPVRDGDVAAEATAASAAPAPQVEELAVGRMADGDAASEPVGSAWSWSAADAFRGFVVIWALGVLVGVVRVLRAARLVRRLKANAVPIDPSAHRRLLARVQEGVERSAGSAARLPSIRVSGSIRQPMTLGGAGRPVVVVPRTWLETLRPDALRDVLVHECAHVLQGDLRLGWLQAAARALLWPHPCIHVAAERLAVAREELCDNWVLAQGEPVAYARTLFDVHETIVPASGVLALGLIPGRWSIEQRIRGLVDHARCTRLRLGHGAAVGLLGAVLGTGGALAGVGFGPTEAVQDPEAAAARSGVSGRVLTPDGAPAVGVDVALRSRFVEGGEVVMAQTDADGRFAFEVDAEDEWSARGARLIARKDGFGMAWSDLLGFRGDAGGTLQLVADVEIRGRVVDLEGAPVEGARVRVAELYRNDAGSLEGWRDALAEPRVGFYDAIYAELPHRLMGTIERATTGADGSFRLRGLGAERLACVIIEGDDITAERVFVASRERTPSDHNMAGAGPAWGIIRVYGTEFEHPCAPTRAIEGTVRGDDGQPVEGVRVVAARVLGGIPAVRVEAVSQADGTYRVVGLPKGEGTELRFDPQQGAPYFDTTVDVPDPSGFEPVALDVELERGRLIRGKVVDAVSGEGLAAMVATFRPGQFDMSPANVTTGPDGEFALVARDGVTFVAAHVEGTDRYRSIHQLMANEEWKNEIGPAADMVSRYHAAARVEVGDEALEPVVLSAQPGIVRQIHFVDAEGRALTGVRACYANAGRWAPATPESHWEVGAGAVGAIYGLIFQHVDRELAAFVRLSEDLGERVEVELAPWGRITGRLVDAEGKPRANEKLELWGRVERATYFDAATSDRIHTDADGRFVLEGLVEGLEYSLRVPEKDPFQPMAVAAEDVFQGVKVGFGKTLELGDVTATSRGR